MAASDLDGFQTCVHGTNGTVMDCATMRATTLPLISPVRYMRLSKAAHLRRMCRVTAHY